jgi:PhzF family phenazine biosynthesis protein
LGHHSLLQNGYYEMELTIYQIDAFTNKVFGGNPAAICPLATWLPDDVMQAIAMENNLSETAFFVPVKSTENNNDFHIRWFTPVTEVNLCGHATLATAFVIFTILDYNNDTLSFESRSGTLTVTRNNDWFEMDFPSQPPSPCKTPEEIHNAFKQSIVESLRSEDYIVVLENEQAVLAANPDLNAISKLDLRGVAITAPGKQHDFVTRFFAPKYGINEDPVTGSAFTQLIPYWSDRLNNTSLTARQVSHRGGEVLCRYNGNRVSIAGQAVKYLQGTIEITN